MKKTLIALAFASIGTGLMAFSWPQQNAVNSDSFYTYFGQLRGNTISNSLVFENPSKVKACDEGFITCVINEYNDESEFFPSTLGNAVIISHKDNLLTIYGNIKETSLNQDIYTEKQVKSGTILGVSGDSGWQQKKSDTETKSALEFQVVDTKNHTAINPRILMPRVGKEITLYFSNVVLQNKNGRYYKIGESPVLPSGSYKVYQKRQQVASPYKTRITVNGTVVDEISYDLLRQEDNILCASGHKNYSKQALYPNNDLQLLGEVSFTQGKNQLQIILLDILGKENVATYFLTNY